jgi:hypothetical protein
MRQHPEPSPRDDKDAAQDIARDLAEIASHIGQLKGDARAYLSDPNYNTLKPRLEAAHSAVEAALLLRQAEGPAERGAVVPPAPRVRFLLGESAPRSYAASCIRLR